jgi:uncharacterized protein (TIGR00297 family)
MALVVQTTMNDTTILLILGAAVGTLTVAMETLARRGVFPQWLCRKVLHLGAVGACAVAPLLLVDLVALTIIVAVAAVLLFFLVGTGVLFREAEGRPSWGIALFPLPYLALLLLFPEAEQRALIVQPMLILAVSDALAAVVGTLLDTPSFTLTGDRKTIGGSLTFVASTWLILANVPGPLSALPTLELHGTAGLFAILLAAAEALGSRGRDNLYIPSVAAMLLAGLPFGGALPSVTPAAGALPAPVVGALATPALGALLTTALVAMPVAAIFVAVTVRKRWLTLGGGVAAALLGVWVILFQGLIWLVPLMVFFISSSALGRALRTRSTSGDAKQGQPRDATQVFANGGIYGLAAALLPTADAQLVMAVSMAVATADTWASEIGIALNGRTYDILRFERVPVGLSGGVSLGGTLGAAAGAMLLGVVGALVLPRSTPFAATAAILAGLGVAGMVLDSALGSLVQGKYRGPSGALQDRPTDGALLVRGAAWMSNDAVNLASNVMVAGLALWFLGN